ncbi:NUDIX domain-containing protein [Phytophthora infestans]|uniref:RxLR effector protein n=1 Tax=Phytophthora infestans TaxID=4787 RepID=A0A833SKI3_PHYIN|nr:NUDIX domain-containing protein [Phytophthora infestans]
MRVLGLVTLIALVSTCSGVLTATDIDIHGAAKVNSVALTRLLAGDHTQTKRFLRRDDLADLDSEDEERGLEKMSCRSNLDALIVKNYDEFAKFARGKKLLNKGVDVAKSGGKLKAMLTKYKTEWATLITKLKDRYPDASKLSLSTLKQLDEMENIRKVDIANGVKGSKKTADGMRRKIEPLPGMELPPPKYMVSHVGRDMQRFDKKDGSRLLSAGVVMRTNEQGQQQILLISSSNPKKGEFLLPKGGWDKGENIKKAALREVLEEGGVKAHLAHGMGKIKFKEDGKDYTYFTYLMKANKIYDDWAESIRYRLWVSLDDAEVMLKGRSHMVKVVKQAKAMNKKIADKVIPPVNPRLAKVKLD